MSENNTVDAAASGSTDPAVPAAMFGEMFRRFLKPMEYFTQVNGRARRGEYWSAALLVLLPTVVLGYIFGFVSVSARSLALFIFLSLPLTALGLFMLPVTIRRWHDHGVSGWLAVATLAVTGFPCSAIPFLGWFLGFAASVTCLVFFCLPGKKCDNAYGADPCNPAAADPAESRKEPWQPLFWAYVGLTALNWIWSIYTTNVAINAVKSLASIFG